MKCQRVFSGENKKNASKCRLLKFLPSMLIVKKNVFALLYGNGFGDSIKRLLFTSSQPASVAQLDAPSDWWPGGRGFNPRRGRQHSFVEIDHEIFSTVILSLPLIQEGQLSVSGGRMCTILVNRLED